MGERRYDSYTKRWVEVGVDVHLAGPNPTQAPPVDPAFLYHLERISERLGRKHRPSWSPTKRCFYIQAQNVDGSWREVYIACDDVRSHEANMYPYMPLDMRVIDDFANSCLELKYATGDIEKDRALDQAARDAMAEEATHQEHEAGVADIARRLTAGASGGDPEDHKRAAKAIRYGHTVIKDGTGFKEIFQVPRAAPLSSSSESK